MVIQMFIRESVTNIYMNVSLDRASGVVWLRPLYLFRNSPRRNGLNSLNKRTSKEMFRHILEKRKQKKYTQIFLIFFCIYLYTLCILCIQMTANMQIFEKEAIYLIQREILCRFYSILQKYLHKIGQGCQNLRKSVRNWNLLSLFSTLNSKLNKL